MMHKILGRIASVRSFVFAAVALAMSAASAFDTPYLTFRSPSSFTLSATKRWDGTLQKATSNPASEASWSEWTGSLITAVESGGQYYIYLRGSNNTIINGNNYSGWTLTGSDIHCEGDIETLRGYDGNVPAMGANCYQYLFYVLQSVCARFCAVLLCNHIGGEMLLQHVPKLHRPDGDSGFPSGDNGDLLLWRDVQGMLGADNTSGAPVDLVCRVMLQFHVPGMYKFDVSA